jgi:hypothetical protein
MSDNCIIGRQPILDRDEKLIGYELLFRSTDLNESGVEKEDARRATANVIINTLAQFGVTELLGGRKGFINVDLDMLMNDTLELLPQEHIVIELLESIKPSPAVIERCLALKEAGFGLALDDHRYHPDFAALYAIVDIVCFWRHWNPCLNSLNPCVGTLVNCWPKRSKALSILWHVMTLALTTFKDIILPARIFSKKRKWMRTQPPS